MPGPPAVMVLGSNRLTDAQILTIVLATVPTIITVLIGIFINGARLNDLRSYMGLRFNDVDRRMEEMISTFRQTS